MLQEAIILAGGFGTRLQSVVSDVPKCMALVNNKPFIFYIVENLFNQGIKKIIFSLGYKNEIVIDYIQNNLSLKYKNIIFDWVVEKEALETGGAIKFSLTKSEYNDVLILNGDTYFNIDINKFYLLFKNSLANCALALKQMIDFDRYGVVEINSNNKIIDFKEKKYYKKGLINAGVYLINKNDFLNCNFQNKFSFEKEYLEKQYINNKIYGFEFNNYFIDIGIPIDFKNAQIDFKNNLF